MVCVLVGQAICVGGTSWTMIHIYDVPSQMCGLLQSIFVYACVPVSMCACLVCVHTGAQMRTQQTMTSSLALHLTQQVGHRH